MWSHHPGHCTDEAVAEVDINASTYVTVGARVAFRTAALVLIWCLVLAQAAILTRLVATAVVQICEETTMVIVVIDEYPTISNNGEVASKTDAPVCGHTCSRTRHCSQGGPYVASCVPLHSRVTVIKDVTIWCCVVTYVTVIKDVTVLCHIVTNVTVIEDVTVDPTVSYSYKCHCNWGCQCTVSYNYRRHFAPKSPADVAYHWTFIALT